MSNNTRRRVSRGVVLTFGLAVVLSTVGAGPASVSAADTRVEIGAGHVDIGPALVDGDHAEILVKDDSGGQSVWRAAEDVTFRVSDVAAHALPDDDQYDFLGAQGDEVFLIPQTRVDGVVWLGWNTQHPGLLAASPAQVTLDVQEVEGPGDLHVYFDYGGFRSPQIIWDGASGEPLEVPLDTHAHANWAFSAPGEYCLTFTAHIDTGEGRTLTASAPLHFLVGDEASTPPAPALDPTILITGGVAAISAVAAVSAIVVLRRKRVKSPAAAPETPGAEIEQGLS